MRCFVAAALRVGRTGGGGIARCCTGVAKDSFDVAVVGVGAAGGLHFGAEPVVADCLVGVDD